jgi:small-conductance mechanosensitive channel
MSGLEQWAQRGLAVIVVQIASALTVALLAFFLTRRIRETTRKSILRVRGDPGLALLIARLVSFGVIAIAFMAILSILGLNWTGIIAVVGAVGLAISLALQDVLKNLFAGLYLLLERPFRIGDHIDVRTFSGEVEDVRLRVTILRTTTGLQVIIPNAIVFTETILNRTAYQHERIVIHVTQPGAGDFRATSAAIIAATKPVESVLQAPVPEVSVVSLTPEKQVFDFAYWTASRCDSLPEVLVAMRSALPQAEIALDQAATK